jgi:hypothetical protein
MLFGTLGLGGVVAIFEKVDNDTQELKLTLQQEQSLKACLHCGSPVQWHGRRDLKMIVDTPSAGLKVKLDIQRRRTRCSMKTCRKVVEPTTPFVQVGFKITKRLYRFMGNQFRDPGQRFDRMAAMIGTSEVTARSVFIDLAEQLEKARERRVVLGSVLHIACFETNKRSRYLLVNVNENALADITSDTDPEQLRILLKSWKATESLRYVWIPADQGVRTVVQAVFPRAQLALTRTALRKAQADAINRVGKIKGKAIRLQADAYVVDVFDTLEGRSVLTNESPKEKLQRLGHDPRLPWLAEWVKTWEEELLRRFRLPGEQKGFQDPTVTRVERMAMQLTLAGYGYSFNILRQRLIYIFEPVLAFDKRVLTIHFMARPTSSSSSSKPIYTTAKTGTPVGEFGVPLDAVLAGLDRAVQAGPP